MQRTLDIRVALGMALVGMLLVGLLTRPGAPPTAAWGCGGDDGTGACGSGVEVQATTGVTTEATTITVTHESCKETLTFAAGTPMGAVKTAFEADLAEGDQVTYLLDMSGTHYSKVCMVSAEGVTLGYVRADATPVATIECGCGFVGNTGPCM